MSPELDPASVAARLAVLRGAYEPERVDAARARLARERPASSERFVDGVARRLAELRALSDLARHLHDVRR